MLTSYYNKPPEKTWREGKQCGGQTMAWGPWFLFRPMYSQMNCLIGNEYIKWTYGLLFWYSDDKPGLILVDQLLFFDQDTSNGDQLQHDQVF